jgi:ABC-type lipopolysaccharide export system ATPase subunit
MNPKELVLAQAEIITLQTKESLKDLKKIALSEAWKILQLATAGVVQIIEKMASDLAGSEKKEIAIAYLNSFYDKVFVVVDIPFVPNIIEPVMHKYVKTFLMIMVSASIDATVTIFRQTGIFLRKEQSV